MSNETQVARRDMTINSDKAISFKPFGAADEIKLSIEIIQNAIAVPTKSGRTCSKRDALKFLMMCQAQRLNPFAGDAYLIGYDKFDKALNATVPVFSLITSHQALMKRAEASADFRGMESGIILLDEAGKVTEREGDFHLEDENVVGGWAKVYREGRKPTYKRLAIAQRKPNYETAFWTGNKASEQIVKCFDEETEILTSLGFEKFSSAEGAVLQVTESGLAPTTAVPFFQPYNGPMIEWSSRNGNFRVTPNHDLPLSVNGEREMPIQSCHLVDLCQRDRAIMPLRGIFEKADFPIEDRFLKLSASYVADGSDNSRSSGFSIGVSRGSKIDMLRGLRLHTSEGQKRDAGQVAVASSGREIRTLTDKAVFYYSRAAEIDWLVGRGKKINVESLLALSQRQAKLFVDTWLSLDGSRPPSCLVGRVYMSRDHHCAAFELAATQAGYSVSERKGRQSDIGKVNFAITIRGEASVRITGQYGQIKQSVAEKGVWCVKVPTGKIVVRRHGFSCISHNCAEADCLRATFPTLVGGLYIQGETDERADKFVSEVSADRASFDTSGLVEKVPAAAQVQDRQQFTDEAEGTDLGPQNQKPAPKEASTKGSFKAELEKLVLSEGFTFDHLQKFALDTGILDNAESLGGFDDVTEKNAERVLRAKTGLLQGLSAIKSGKGPK